MLEVRRARNRASAARSRDNRALRWDDLVAENYALKQEEYEAEKALYDLELEKRQLFADIHAKTSKGPGEWTWWPAMCQGSLY